MIITGRGADGEPGAPAPGPRRSTFRKGGCSGNRVW